MTTRNIVILFALLVLAAFIVGIARDSKPAVSIPTVTSTDTTPIDMCYYYRSAQASNGFYDRAWIRLHITGEQVTGEFNNYPAEKDSKVGTFTGTVAALDQASMSRTATVIWNTLGEGMQAKEELLISFGDGSAAAAFGEMVQGANGVYVYKDKSQMTYQQQLSQIDCASLDEIVAVEKYVKATIATIVTDKAVLGGTWFVTSIDVNPATDTATVAYEDGHIAGKGTVTYTFAANKVTVNSFAKAK